MTQPSAINNKDQRRDLIKILLSIYFFFTAMGINIVIFPVILKYNNLSETMIGFSVIVELLAGIIFAHQIVRLLKSQGVKPFLKAATCLHFGIMMLIGHYPNFIIWLGFVSLIGVYWYAFSMIKQSWYNTIIPNKNRNFWISINTMVLCSGFASGSYIVSLLGSLNLYNFIISSSFSYLAYYCMSLIKTPLPEIRDDVSHKVAEYLRAQPLLYFAKFTQEVVSISILSFVVIYAIDVGFAPEQGAILASCYTLSALLNLFVARCLDKFCHRRIFLIASMCLSISLIGMFCFQEDFRLLAILCFASGFFVSFYYIGCEARVNYFFCKNQRIGANNSLSFVTNCGGIVGCILTGFLMYHIGNIGFILPALFGQIIIILLLLFSNTKSYL